MITVKEYAERKNVSIQGVHQKIKRHSQELKGHVKTIKGVKHLDDFAVKYLDGLDELKQDKHEVLTPGVKRQMDELRSQADKLREENQKLKDEIIEKINEKYKGSFSDADRVLITALQDKLMKLKAGGK